MSETYDLFQQGRSHLRKGRAAQATVALEKAKKREPDKASIREALGIAYFLEGLGQSMFGSNIYPIDIGMPKDPVFLFDKVFPGGILVLTGANSATGLRSMPARYVFLDEVDAYPASADEEGDPVTLAEARTTTFAHRRKVFMVSTPTVRGLSRIEREFEASDQRRYFVPCPHCGAMQWLKFDRLRWQKGRPETAEYHCEGCETPIAEHHKTAMLEGGEWRATAMAADPTTQRWWAICKPCQQPLESRAPDEWWANMEEVFHTN